MTSRTARHLVAVAAIVIATGFATDAHAAWPLGQPTRSHVKSAYRGYSVAPTYSYMPMAYPYGAFGARGYSPRTVYYDHNNYLRSWGPWPGH